MRLEFPCQTSGPTCGLKVIGACRQLPNCPAPAYSRAASPRAHGARNTKERPKFWSNFRRARGAGHTPAGTVS
jgi:hypothetical protein